MFASSRVRAFLTICALVASAGSAGAQSPTATGDGSAVENGTPAAQPALPPATLSAQPGGVVPGPLEAERKLLLSRIDLAKKHGIGTSVYLSEFNKVEEQVKGGAQADAIKGRIESLTRSLADQLQRGRNLKTQRPTPPAGSQQGGPDPVPAATASAGPAAAPGAGSGSLADKLKSITNDLPPGTLEKLMQNDKARNILQHLK
ncbi:MAG: hypothetical protein U0105_25500 [Candidatus Obscuribacterales bacterium]